MADDRRAPSLGRTVAGFGLVRVRGRSMLPTLGDGDLLLVRTGRPPKVGDVVVLRLPGREGISVKRLVRREAEGWWVERDNPREGVDSWSVGAVPATDVVAEVVMRVWPLRRIEGPPPL